MAAKKKPAPKTTDRSRLLTPAQVKAFSMHHGPPHETFIFRTMTKSELARAYGISLETLKKWWKMIDNR